jgi:hypothetical protein
LSSRWSKERRFQEVLKQISYLLPSKLVRSSVGRILPLDNSSDVEEVYSKLSRGDILVAAFDYRQ